METKKANSAITKNFFLQKFLNISEPPYIFFSKWVIWWGLPIYGVKTFLNCWVQIFLNSVPSLKSVWVLIEYIRELALNRVSSIQGCMKKKCQCKNVSHINILGLKVGFKKLTRASRFIGSNNSPTPSPFVLQTKFFTFKYFKNEMLSLF